MKEESGLSDKVQYVIGAVISVVLISVYLILGGDDSQSPQQSIEAAAETEIESEKGEK